MYVVAIIPARMNSTRFYGKPLKKIKDIPMIGHCYFRAKMSKYLNETYVATCDNEISDYVKKIGGTAIMTSKKHQRASDRTAEAMKKIEKKINRKIDIVVMIQGDEPMITPEMINKAILPFKKNKKINVVNLMSKIRKIKEAKDPNEVKVVVDKENNAVYFSRESIPSNKKINKKNTYYKQVCIMPFRRNALINFNNLQETKLEKIESVDMLRFIENNIKVHMVLVNEETYSVDTPKDLKIVNFKMKNNKLLMTYLKKAMVN